MDGFGIASVTTLMAVDLDQDLRISKGRVSAMGGGGERASRGSL